VPLRKLAALSMVQGAVLGAALFAAACTHKDSASSTPLPTPVRTAVTTTGPSQPPILASGLVLSKEQMRLSFKVGGVIKDILVEEGQTVRQGQRLAQIELAEIDSQVEQAQVMADKAQRDLERAERLYKDRLISLGQVQDLRSQAEMQKAQLQTARFNRSYAEIIAPRDGVLLRRLAEERELVPAGQPVLLLGAKQRGYVVRAALADRELMQLKLGDSAEVTLDAYPGQTFAATVTEIASTAESGSGLFSVEARLKAPPERLVDGLVAKLKFHSSAAGAQQLTYVPIAAVVEGDGDTASVFLIEEQSDKTARAKRQAITVAFITPDGVALRVGPAPGTRVVTEGALFLEDQELIDVLPPESTQHSEDAPLPSASPSP
jgi:multidrug efflux system membrane fusion protein